MECPVCLEEGGDPCVCGRKYHAHCLYGLLKNGFECCPICFARLPPGLFLLGAAYAHTVEASDLSKINLAAALTGNGQAHDALVLLCSIQPLGLRMVLQAFFYVEKGRVYLQLESPGRAIRSLQAGIHCILQVAPRGHLHVRALAFLCRAYCKLGDEENTRETARFLVSLPHKMHYTDAIYTMSTLADMFHAKGCLDRHMAALGTICEILDEESKDPFEKAQAHAELGCAEAKLGINSCHRLANALPMLRKRPRGVTARAASSLASQLRLVKRLRKKTHPEDTIT